ncbi:MAG: WD40 repeat domain-containing protein [Chloroflexi bacterium]|nr:WD40 repeat domain-containing protein [Chloroflexota bacterium]
MMLTQHALTDNDVGLALGLLNKHRPTFVVPASAGSSQPGSSARPDLLKAGLQTDLRDWEWRYLWQLCQPDHSVRLQTNSGPISAVAVSQDGRAMAAQTGSHQVALWDLNTRRLRADLMVSSSIGLLRLSPTGSFLAVSGRNAQKEPTLEVWDVPTGKREATLTRSVLPKSLAFSPDGCLLASLENHRTNATVTVTEWAANRTIIDFTVPPLRYSAAGVVTFSPDEGRLAIGEEYGTIRILNWRTGNLVTITNLAKVGEGVSALAFSPTGELLASASGYTSGTIRLWEVNSGELRGELTNRIALVSELVFTPDGRRLASATADHTICIWDVAKLVQLQCWRGHAGEGLALAFLPDGRTLASGCGESTICFWDSTASNPAPAHASFAISMGLESPSHLDASSYAPGVLAPGVVRRFAFAFAPDGRSFITSDPDGSLGIWDAQTMQRTERLPGLGSNHWGVALLPDGRWLATGDDSGKVTIWDWPSRRRVKTLKLPFEWFGSLGFSRSGNCLLARSVQNDHTVQARIWRTMDWAEVSLAQTQTAGIASADLSPDDRLLATGHTDGAVNLWRSPSGEHESRIMNHRRTVTAVAFSPDGRLLASASWDGGVGLWDVAARRELATLQGHLGGVWDVAFSPDGRRLASGGSGAKDAVKLWDVATQREILSLAGEGEMFFHIAFSPDVSTVMASSFPGVAHLWRAPSWEEIAVAEGGRVAP